MKTSVIIVNYNTPDLTKAAVASVLRFSQGHNLEVIVVDNASTVGNLDMLDGLERKVKLVNSPENVGFAKGNNLGLEHSDGDLIILLNSDAEFASDCIGQVSSLLAQDPAIGIVTGQIRYPDGRLQYPAGRFPSLGSELKELFRVTKSFSNERSARFYLGDRMETDTYQEVDWVWGAFFAFPRTLLRVYQKNRLPDDFFMYYEDVLWCHLAKKAGYKVVYDPEIRVVHHLSASLNAHSEEAKYREKIFPNELTFLKKHYGQWYTRLYYLVKSLHYLSLRETEKAKFYFINGVRG